MGKILVFGDSLTYGKWDKEGGWVARLRKHIDRKYNIGQGGNFQVFNLGVPGETSAQLAKRVKNELAARVNVLEHNLVIFATGINDSYWVMVRQTSKPAFQKTINNMITLAKKQKCKVVFLGLTPVKPAKSKGRLSPEKEVKKYDGYITEVCRKNRIPKIQLFGALERINFTNKLPDGLHPDFRGHQMMAKKIISFLEKEGLVDYCAC